LHEQPVVSLRTSSLTEKSLAGLFVVSSLNVNLSTNDIEKVDERSLAGALVNEKGSERHESNVI